MSKILEVPNKWIRSIEARRYLYRILAVVVSIVGLSPSISPEQLPLWLELGAAILGITTGATLEIAASNTPKAVEEAVAEPREMTAAERRELDKAELEEYFKNVRKTDGSSNS